MISHTPRGSQVVLVTTWLTENLRCYQNRAFDCPNETVRGAVRLTTDSENGLYMGVVAASCYRCCAQMRVRLPL